MSAQISVTPKLLIAQPSCLFGSDFKQDRGLTLWKLKPATPVGEATVYRYRYLPSTQRRPQPQRTKLTCSEGREIITADIPVFFDSHPVPVLVDTGAGYSVMNGSLATLFRKVTTAWYGSPVRAGGGHLVVPIGVSIARVHIRFATFPGSFVVMQECLR